MYRPIIVHCRAEYAYPGRPLRLIWEEREYHVEQVLRAWREPDAHCFLVATNEGIFELTYLLASDDWMLRQFTPTF
ncbi:MAG: hypothetical protein MI924_18945 [Chloroflexales bacterium]|nr:hypothetical protein [Chloroflexales bacterium]